MKRVACIRRSPGGFTTVELIITVTILCILMAVIGASYETFKARIRYSTVKADLDAIGMAGYRNFTDNEGIWDFSPDPWTPPPSIMGDNLLKSWPQAPCPGWYFSWDNGQPFGLNVIRVSVRNANDAAVFSYCVNTFGGGDCNAEDTYSQVTGHSPPVEISTADVKHIYCNE